MELKSSLHLTPCLKNINLNLNFDKIEKGYNIISFFLSFHFTNRKKIVDALSHLTSGWCGEWPGVEARPVGGARPEHRGALDPTTLGGRGDTRRGREKGGNR